jgi:hypothetical protein
MNEEQNRKKIVFISSSYVNLAHIFALNNDEMDIFLIIDRKVPFDFDQDCDNFYIHTFDKRKIYEKSPNSYFDTLAVYINSFEPDVVISDNFDKRFAENFVEFFNFTSPRTHLINIHHGDLRILNKEGKQIYNQENSFEKQFFNEELIVSTVHKVTKEDFFGEILYHTKETSLKELKQKGFLKKKEEIINFRIKNVILLYHERSKLLTPLVKIVEKLFKQ